jgi:tRNA1(Val) A37 N6-methylase TrmN6
MSVRQAERILEIFENGSKNGEQWAHDVVLHRGTDKYQPSIDTLNEAFRIKSIRRIVKPLEIPHETAKKA